MSDSQWTQERKLTNRIVDVLKWTQCASIRFKLELVGIQSFMYLHTSNAVREGAITVQVNPNSSPYFDPDARLMSLPKADPEPNVIVHEATHALILTTHVGKVLSVITHEAAAYLAEAVFSMNLGNKPQLGHLPGVYNAAYRLAALVKYHNDRNSSGMFECPAGLVGELKDALRKSPLRQGWDDRYWQGGLKPSPRTHTEF
jgi:hypothetical protein